VNRKIKLNGSNEICRSVERSLDEYFKRLDGETPTGVYDMVIGHVERALHLISQALQKVAQVRSQNQDEAHLGEEAEFVALCRQIEEMCRLAGLRIMLDRPPE